MSRIDYSLWNDDDEIRNFDSAAKAVSNVFQDSLELAIPRESAKLSLDVVIRSVVGDSFIEICPQYSILPGVSENSYWASSFAPIMQEVAEDGSVTASVFSKTHRIERISDGYAGRLVFDVSSTSYFKLKIKGDVGGSLVHVYASLSE